MFGKGKLSIDRHRDLGMVNGGQITCGGSDRVSLKGGTMSFVIHRVMARSVYEYRGMCRRTGCTSEKLSKGYPFVAPTVLNGSYGLSHVWGAFASWCPSSHRGPHLYQANKIDVPCVSGYSLAIHCERCHNVKFQTPL